jgi:hypothetical protein
MGGDFREFTDLVEIEVDDIFLCSASRAMIISVMDRGIAPTVVEVRLSWIPTVCVLR